MGPAFKASGTERHQRKREFRTLALFVPEVEAIRTTAAR
jgi:hypothetical protein